jgi:hypothetical protein
MITHALFGFMQFVVYEKKVFIQYYSFPIVIQCPLVLVNLDLQYIQKVKSLYGAIEILFMYTLDSMKFLVSEKKIFVFP